MSEHTKEPWRWEINTKHKTVSIVGGVPTFDLTVMDFERWGMGGAVPRFRDTAHDGMNIMYRLCDRPDWIAPFQGREHHADWCANVIHPDARRIVAAVNAVAGMPQADLEELAKIDGGVMALTVYADDMRQQRDQLLAALEAAVACGIVPITSASEGGASKYAQQVIVADQIRAAIAMVKGDAS